MNPEHRQNAGYSRHPSVGRTTCESRDRLRRLAATLAATGELARAGDGSEHLAVPILVRADRWTPWARVQGLLQIALAPDVGFWRVEFAVTREHAAGEDPGGK